MGFPNKNPLGYVGLNQRKPPDRFFRDRAPDTTDVAIYSIGDIWIDTQNRTAYMLMNKEAGVADWILFTSVIVGTQTLEGDTGGAVPPNGLGNTFLVGGTGVNTTGNPGTNTITIDAHVSVPTQVTADTGSATPAANNLNVFGGTGVSTTGAGSTITIDQGVDVPLSFPTDSGTAVSTANSITVTGGTSISTSASGTAITIDAAAEVPTTVTADTGTATPAANNLNVIGGANITTTGAGDTLTIDVTGLSGTFTTDAGVATSAGSNINVVGGAGVTTSGSGDTVTITSSGGLSWNNVSTGTQALSSNNGYIATFAAGITFTLPASSSLGDVIAIVGNGANTWTITQAAGQSINLVDSSTTVGVGGSLSSIVSEPFSSIYLICVTPSFEWTILGGTGNYNIV